MSKLDGKKIKIDGKKFEVQAHLTNPDENLESLILTRPIHKLKDKSDPVENIQQLGYRDEDAVTYSHDEMKDSIKVIHSRVGKKIDITMILDAGRMSDTSIKIVGANWENPDLIDIIFMEDNHEVSISRELLAKSLLLHTERHLGNSKSKKSFDTGNNISDSSKKRIDELIGGIDSLLDDIRNRTGRTGRKGRGDQKGRPYRDTSEKFNDEFADLFGTLFKDGKQPSHRPQTGGLEELLSDLKSNPNLTIDKVDINDAPDVIKDLVRSLKRDLNGR